MKKAKSGIRGIIIFLICVIEIYPLFWMLTASMKQQSEWSEKPAYALNKGFYLQNFVDAWTRGHMATYFKNSLITTVVSLIFIVIFSVTVGFAVTKMQWKLRNAVAKYFTLGIMIPVAVALIPLFQIYSKTNLLNTRICLILTYIAFGLSLSIYLVQGSLRSFSDEIMEAAVIDGCGIYRMMWYIVVPLMKNAIVTVLVLQFFFKWNDLLFSMTFISDSSLKTVQTGLLYFSDEFGSKNWGAIFASVSMSVFPMLILYTALNKKVMEGMTAGAVKG
ncbi:MULTISPECIES: carbohydrate ABC transporter permease [Clostridia]|uniref:carbohydrate ABC transporter permease n=1 Tax=Clostridia TaxID=186801 RepID=UPI000EB30288|nr:MULTISPECIES: carbohydrate ABC transporter permease [Clostridia]RKQ30698.1 carbohydrate ABC transporter permease [Ruminococcus sp. B05]TAP33952.1 carbohydrate ABC transporter permease [Mediterraneibacter sp. gm002]